MKRDVVIAYFAMRKIHYNVMRFRVTLNVDEAEGSAARFSSVSGRHYVLHDPEKVSRKISDYFIGIHSNFIYICYLSFLSTILTDFIN